MLRIYIDGLPGTNKREIATNVARQLGVPLYAADGGDAIESKANSGDADSLAIWLLWIRATFSISGPGVFVGSPESWQCRANLKFETTSSHPSARALRDVANALRSPSQPTHRVVICATPDQVMEMHPEESRPDLEELKNGEDNLPDADMMYNVDDCSIADSIVAHVSRPVPPMAQYM